MPTRRQRRVSELIHRELGMLLTREVRDPRLSSVTITGVEVSPDLLLAYVHFSVLGDAAEEEKALAGLQHAGGYLRTELAGRVRLRFVPELVFRVDRSATYGRRIEEILDQLRSSNESGDEEPDADNSPIA